MSDDNVQPINEPLLMPTMSLSVPQAQQVHAATPPKPVVLVYPALVDVMHTARDVAIKEAHAGVVEVGGNNRGPRVEEYQSITGGGPGDSWCDDFKSWCLMTAFAMRMGWETDVESMLTHVGLFGRLYFTISGYCPATWHSAKQRGYTRDASYHPDSGDLVLYDFSQIGEPHHIEIVIQVDPDTGDLKTVGGNTTSGIGGPQGDGGGVFIRHRVRKGTLSRVFGYIHAHK